MRAPLADGLPTLERRGARALAPTRALIDSLAEHSVRYCHWKGNAHLDRVLRGEKDIDLLVDAKSSRIVASVLDQTGFRRAADAPGCGYPGVEHYLAPDHLQARIAHLHLHWQLIPTKHNPHCVHLPWEELVLATRIMGDAHDVYIVAPDIELVLLLVRAAMGIGAKHVLAEALGRKGRRDRALIEMRWLLGRTSRGALLDRARELIGDQAAHIAIAAVDTELSALVLRSLHAAMVPALATYGGGRLPAARTTIARGRTVLGGRTLPNGGRIVAFLGSDGAGKSTVVRAVTAWLGAELDVRPVYFGSGDGTTSALRRVLRLVDRVRRSVAPRRGGVRSRREQSPTAAYLDGSSYLEGVQPGARALWKLASKLALAREKRERLAAAWSWRTRGAVVICDRYPQTQQFGFNDGPQLTPWLVQGRGWMRAAARRELAAYAVARVIAPDLVIKLVVSPETAAARKDDMSPDLLRARAAAIRALSFPASTRVVEIDSDQPLEAVLAAARAAIWDSLWS